MAQSTDSADVTAQPAPVLGDCVLTLTHATTYEPPLYLFPELLPQVPQGTPPLPVWDAVADAVNIAASSWRIADATRLVAAGAAAAAAGEASGSAKAAAAGERRPQAMVTLASMIADNRLVAAGLDATALANGAFSSAAIITHLATLQARMGLSDEEGAAIMSNHFINLLAWQKLRELNEASARTRTDARTAATSASASSTAAVAQAETTSSRKRLRAAQERDDGEERQQWLASPHPWATDAELKADADGNARFVAASETNVERQVELLRTLTELYQRPWRALASRGQQTDFVIPPGTVNVTSPFADNTKVPGAMVDPVTDLGWVPTASHSVSQPSQGVADFFGGVCVAHAARFYAVLITSASSASEGAPTRVPLDELTTYFGRDAGVRAAAATAAAALVPIRGALGPHAAHPAVLSRFHFALVLKPVYEQVAGAEGAPESLRATELKNTKQEPCDDDGDEGGSSGESETLTGQVAVVHTKRPHHYTLWLVNYGRNGVRVAGKGWVLGEPRQLVPGDVLVVGDEVELRVEEHATATAARAVATNGVSQHSSTSATPSQVKRERLEEE